MKLLSFHVWDFRSIDDSGPIDVSRITALVGRNESGKTNLLLALQSLNPPTGSKPLSKIKDFPRHRRLEECTDKTKVLHTNWELTPEEQEQLTALFPRARNVVEIHILRSYGNERQVGFKDLPPLALPKDDIASKLRKLKLSISSLSKRLDATKISAVDTEFSKLELVINNQTELAAWANSTVAAIGTFKNAIATHEIALSENATGLLDDVVTIATEIANDEKSHGLARTWAVKKLPVFVYLDDYPELLGHQNVAQFLSRKEKGVEHLTEADRNFEKLCKVAGLSPENIETLRSEGQQETRNQLANRAGSVVTCH